LNLITNLDEMPFVPMMVPIITPSLGTLVASARCPLGASRSRLVFDGLTDVLEVYSERF
jgi:hypothetical protein